MITAARQASTPPAGLFMGWRALRSPSKPPSQRLDRDLKKGVRYIEEMRDTMLNEAMKAVRVTDMEYASEIADLLNAAYLDLQIAGVVIDGEVDITITETVDQTTGETTYTATDSSDIEDPLVLQAMNTYVRVHFGSPVDYDRLAASYDLQRRQLANATGYTDFGDTPAEG